MVDAYPNELQSDRWMDMDFFLHKVKSDDRGFKSVIEFSMDG